MSDDKLTFVQRCALVILMAEAREVPNAHLINVRKLDLKKTNRDALRRAGLINVTQARKGGPLSIELTDKGWSRAITELGSDVPARAGSGGAALYAVLEKLRRYVDRVNLSPQEVFSVPDHVEAVPEDIEARVRKAYGEIAQRAGDYVMLARLRKSLPDVARADLDGALVRLVRQPDVQIVPESNQKALTDEYRAGAVSIGNQDRHLIAIGS